LVVNATFEAGPDLVFATQDRYVTAAALSDDEWAGMCRALKREDLLEDPRFKTSRARAYNSAERRALIAAEFEKWRADEILPRLVANDVPSAPVLRRHELLSDARSTPIICLKNMRTLPTGVCASPGRPPTLIAHLRKFAALLLISAPTTPPS
jgi:crotonobetainyl-CoA:carnitine CoA-transferase CaiB-like acyl-CoA transferase